MIIVKEVLYNQNLNVHEKINIVFCSQDSLYTLPQFIHLNANYTLIWGGAYVYVYVCVTKGVLEWNYKKIDSKDLNFKKCVTLNIFIFNNKLTNSCDFIFINKYGL